MENKEKEPTALNSTDLSASAARKLIYRLLIVVAMGVGFGKIVSIDSVYDRAIQNYRLQQIPKTLEQKAKELLERGVGEERFGAEMKRVSQALWADANKARPTLSANDRSRWATIRALVEPKMRVYRYVPVVDSAEKNARIKELNADKLESEQTSEFKYYPNEILRNTRFDCPDQFTREKAEASRYKSQYVPYAIDNVWETPGWDSIDVVKHGLNDEVFDPSNPSSGYIYSSKPTLLPTVMAGPYWILYNWFGVSMEDKPFEAVRILLIVYNLVPLGIAFLCLARSSIRSARRTGVDFCGCGDALCVLYAYLCRDVDEPPAGLRLHFDLALGGDEDPSRRQVELVLLCARRVLWRVWGRLRTAQLGVRGAPLPFSPNPSSGQDGVRFHTVWLSRRRRVPCDRLYCASILYARVRA